MRKEKEGQATPLPRRDVLTDVFSAGERWQKWNRTNKLVRNPFVRVVSALRNKVWSIRDFHISKAPLLIKSGHVLTPPSFLSLAEEGLRIAAAPSDRRVPEERPTVPAMIANYRVCEPYHLRGQNDTFSLAGDEIHYRSAWERVWWSDNLRFTGDELIRVVRNCRSHRCQRFSISFNLSPFTLCRFFFITPLLLWKMIARKSRELTSSSYSNSFSLSRKSSLKSFTFPAIKTWRGRNMKKLC